MTENLGVSDLVFETGDESFPKGVQTDNYVRTTRYTLLTFIPLTLYENFQRFANIYFLILAVLGFFPFSPIAARCACPAIGRSYGHGGGRAHIEKSPAGFACRAQMTDFLLPFLIGYFA